MKFSILLEAQISEPTPEGERRLFHECIEQVVLADQLGYHGVWATEHHGLFEFSHSSAPECLLSFVAARTRRIRIGHGVTLTPQRYNHPIRIAERVATLDILSEGRVNWGSGKGASRVEREAFEVDTDTLHEQWLEALEMIPRMWRSDVFEWSGRFYRIPPTAIVPKPVQRPHPPVFVACSQAPTAVLAGSLGAGSLNFSAGTEAELAERVRAYRRAVSGAKAEGRRVNDHFACTPTSIVLPDDRQACEYGFRGGRFFAECLGSYFFGGQRPVGPLDVTRDRYSARALDEAMAGRNREGSQLVAVNGDPVAARETVARFQAAGVDELILVMQMGTVPHEIVCESLRTFAEHVAPHFA
ncbi:MAG TPA: LLM class flavin-dependent oxidoreductase [Vicinamibacteria bacterium]|nr:LLM class flavin-dependent oxidoreductase [Vicinamibacteria bacterium]